MTGGRAAQAHRRTSRAPQRRGTRRRHPAGRATLPAADRRRSARSWSSPPSRTDACVC